MERLRARGRHRDVQFGTTLSMTLVLTLHLRDDLGWSPLRVAVTTLPSALGFALAASLSWRLVSRYGRRSVVWALAGSLPGRLAQPGAHPRPRAARHGAEHRPAAFTTTVSPGRRRAELSSRCQAVSPRTSSARASASRTPGGTSTAAASSTTARPANRRVPDCR
jgi:hypothetical protein